MGREPRGGGLLFAEFRFARFHAAPTSLSAVGNRGRARAPFSRPSPERGPFSLPAEAETGSYPLFFSPFSRERSVTSLEKERENPAETARAPILVDVAVASFSRKEKKEKLVPPVSRRSRSKRQVRGGDLIDNNSGSRREAFEDDRIRVRIRIDPVSLHRFLDFSFDLTSPLPSGNNTSDKTARKTVGTSPPQITQITLAWSWPTARVIHQPPRTTSLPPSERHSPRPLSVSSS